MANPIGPVVLKVKIDGEWAEVGTLSEALEFMSPSGIKMDFPNSWVPLPTLHLKSKSGNVVGGSLDGATIPEGTRDKQTLVWDSESKRWRG